MHGLGGVGGDVMKRSLGILLWFGLAWSLMPGTPRAAEGIAEFAAANRLYEQGKFQEAAAAYERLVQSGPPRASVHFNLGNAWLKTQRLGLAIAEFRRAAQLDPRDPDVRVNLALARGKLSKPPAPAPVWRTFLGQLRLVEWMTIAGVATWSLVGALGLSRLNHALARRLRGWIPLGGVLAMLAVFLAGAALYGEWAHPVGVVVTKETKARYGPLEESKEIFNLTDGMEVRVLEIQGNWANVELPGLNRPGWVNLQHMVVLH